MPRVLMAMGLDCINQAPGIDAFERLLTCRIDIRDYQDVRLIKGSCKIFKAILRPRVAVRLKHHDNAMISRLAGCIERSPHFCGMMPVVIDHGDAARLPFDLKAGDLVITMGAGNVWRVGEELLQRLS